VKSLEQLPPIATIKDRIDDFRANLALRRLHEFYAPKVEEAVKAKDWQKRDEILSEWQSESELVLHPVYARKADRITARARKYGIIVPPKPSLHNYGGDSDDWYLSNITGEWLLQGQLEQRL
jgi:hypothetical protein